MTANLVVTNMAPTTLAMKLKVSAEIDALSTSIEYEGERNINHLEELVGATFVCTYIDNENIDNQSVIVAISNVPTQNINHKKLETLSNSAYPAFFLRLEQAKQMKNMSR